MAPEIEVHYNAPGDPRLTKLKIGVNKNAVASTSSNGLMSAADKTKLNALAEIKTSTYTQTGLSNTINASSWGAVSYHTADIPANATIIGYRLSLYDSSSNALQLLEGKWNDIKVSGSGEHGLRIELYNPGNAVTIAKATYTVYYI